MRSLWLDWLGKGLGLVTLVGASSSARASEIDLLSAEDEQHYRAAFIAADSGDIVALQTEIAAIRDPVLMGHVFGQFYLSPNDRATYPEFAQWLAAFADHPQATRIYQIALSRRGAEDPAPTAPIAVSPPKGRPARPPQPPASTAADREALAAVSTAFFNGDDLAAFQGADALLDGPMRQQAAWYAGLAAWRYGDADSAGAAFELAATAPAASIWDSAAAAYWAARANLKTGYYQRVTPFLERAAAHPFTLYGALAERQLGRASTIFGDDRLLSFEEGASLLTLHASARRSAALVELGRMSDARMELRRLHGEVGADQLDIYRRFVAALQLPDMELRVAELGGPDLAAAQAPHVPWEPADGFRLDKAMIFGLMRQESRYDPQARSSAPAYGLMQLLPSTAAWITGETELKEQPALLYDPAINMRAGQIYLEYLLTEVDPDGSLLKIFASYNAGPNRVKRWTAERGDSDDPLLYIETIPIKETRDYVKRVFANMVFYRARFGQNDAALSALAAGNMPTYNAEDAQVFVSDNGHADRRLLSHNAQDSASSISTKVSR